MWTIFQPAGVAAQDHRLDHDPVDVLALEAAFGAAFAGDQGEVSPGMAGSAQPLRRHRLGEGRVGAGMVKGIFGLGALDPAVLEDDSVVGDQRQRGLGVAPAKGRVEGVDGGGRVARGLGQQSLRRLARAVLRSRAARGAKSMTTAAPRNAKPTMTSPFPEAAVLGGQTICFSTPSHQPGHVDAPSGALPRHKAGDAPYFYVAPLRLRAFSKKSVRHIALTLSRWMHGCRPALCTRPEFSALQKSVSDTEFLCADTAKLVPGTIFAFQISPFSAQRLSEVNDSALRGYIRSA